MRARRDSYLSALALGIAAVALGQALQYANGAYTPDALEMVTLALGLTFLVVLAPQPGEWLDSGFLKLGLIGAVAGLARELYVHLIVMPGIYLRPTSQDFMLQHHRLVAVAAVLTGVLIVLERGLARTLAVIAYAGLFVGLGVWILQQSPTPIIDVVSWHQVSFEAFARGTNPYGITMPNIYGHTMWYAPGLADATTVKVGFPYPPLTFLLSGFAHWVAHDYRYLHVVAIAASGLLFAFARPGRLGPIAMAVLFFSPRSLFVLEQGWTEPLSILAFSAVVFCACRFPKALPYALGALFATKQYYVLIAPLVVLLLPGPFKPREFARVMLKAGAVAAVITLPFFLWDPGAFWRSVVEFQGKQPFRVEALSYVAATAVNGVPTMPLWLSFPVILPGLALALWRSPKTPAAFAAGSALVFTLFFAFAKQAFCNYYFLIVGMLCAAIAATGEPDASTGDASSPS